jgi:hypothetical protein
MKKILLSVAMLAFVATSTMALDGGKCCKDKNSSSCCKDKSASSAKGACCKDKKECKDDKVKTKA